MTERRQGSKGARSRRPASLTVKVSVAATGAVDFSALVGSIKKVHERCAAQAGRAVNLAVTMRNWATGLYIREYEQHGRDRAA